MKTALLLAMVGMLLWITPAWATRERRYTTKVIDVVDGNAIVISNKFFAEGMRLPPHGPIRLDGIDAPKLDQPGGKEAKSFLVDLLKGKEISVREMTDMDESRGAWVSVDDPHGGKTKVGVNLLMLQKGLAKPGKVELDGIVSPDQIEKAAQQAREQKIGIWAVDTNTVGLIERLNVLVETNALSQGRANTNREPATVSAEDKEIVRVTMELASHGVSVRRVNGQYVDATLEAANGYPLSRKAQKSLALLNSLKQTNDRYQKMPGVKLSGESRSHAEALRQELEAQGISLSWEKDKGIYVVTSGGTSDSEHAAP